MKCPSCKEKDLVMSERQGIEIDYCPECRGVWLDRGEDIHFESRNFLLEKSNNNFDPAWQLQTHSTENYNAPTLSNGGIGLVLSEELMKTQKVILANVYDKEFEGGVSRVVAGFEFLNLRFIVDGKLVTQKDVKNWRQELNMRTGMFTTSFDVSEKMRVVHTFFALRHLPYMGLATVNIKSNQPVKLVVQTMMGVQDGELKNVKSEYRVLLDGEIKLPLFQSTGKSRLGKHEISAATAFLFEEAKSPLLSQVSFGKEGEACQFEKSLAIGEDYSFALAGGISTTKNVSDPKSEAERFAIYCLKQGKKVLIDGHLSAWERLWENDIMIEGDLESQQAVRFALFNLYSFSRENSRLSISPMGLSSQGYNGHVFWDTELWMFPPLLVLNHGIAESLLDYRFDRLQKAKEKAQAFGFLGAMFPWESDDSGEEATPTWALTGTFEHHITADVGVAFWNYYRVTKNKQWLREKGFPVLKEVADFWASRTTKNSDGTYSINNVVGADEYAQNVDDNAFTNGSAKVCLESASKAAKELGEIINPKWLDVAKKMKFHFNKEGIMLEHRTYNGEKIKQGDVNLLAYPLGITTNKVQIMKELKYYESKMDEEWGPAMGHSILSVIYSGMGEKEEAFRLFKKSYIPNSRPPFGVLSESPKSNNPYFATGAGGMLQAVLFGFGGLKITDAGIVQGTPCLPKSWKKLVLKGIGISNKTIVIE
ncbi:hypothetical protein CHS0354_000825 [Potamilus streckersoni]|uniref:Uncharacterized protein n=1 Tax=Potamilus streckersoni TaxID=2493646 RepID=A0AAE0T7M2_9BIVA|nr:hypothetical protein CHS0354_000825 [Potamilus streckersoni]